MLLNHEVTSEYEPEMEQLKAEDDKLAEAEESIKKRRSEIKARVKEVALVTGGKKDRIIIPAGEHGAWDRRVTSRGEGLDVGKLEKILGERDFRRLCCIRQVVYTPSVEKIEVSRLGGKLDEADINKAMSKGTPVYSLYKMTERQLDRLIEKELS